MIKKIYKFLLKRVKIEYYNYLDSDFYLKHFHRKHVSALAQMVRKKHKIKVAFVLHDIAKWKTEALYLAMKEHPRFDPVIVTTITTRYSYLSTAKIYICLIESLQQKGYPYIQASKDRSLYDIVSPDIVFYQEPYPFVIPTRDFYKSSAKTLFCFVNYAFHNIMTPNLVNEHMHNRVWHRYFENSSAAHDIMPQMTNKGINSVITGFPIADLYRRPLYSIPNPWKKLTLNRKKVIWAPHHTIPQTANAFEQSTFLNFADKMLFLANKYKDTIQWAFKPHPVLLTKLIEIWGGQKTDAYFRRWQDNDYSQIETGEYTGLFMHSDAMIHDCSSFIIEYQYTHNPIFFIRNNEEITKNHTTYSKRSFDLHYKGSTIEEIERFIINVVIEGNDPLKPERDNFYQDFLLPPNGQSASENIIDAILGQGAYKD